MTWNYRVVLKDGGYHIREVYYNKNGKIKSWTKGHSSPYGETINELRDDIKYMKEALKLPILREEYDDRKQEHRLVELL